MEVAEYAKRWNMTYDEISGSDGYVRRLLEVAVDLSRAENDFWVIPPGGIIEG